VFTFPLDNGFGLRLLEEHDSEALYDVVIANRELLARWMPWAAQQTLDGTLAFIRSSRQQIADNKGFQAAITDRDAIAGMIGFDRMDWGNRSASLGYWLAERCHGRGVVTDASVP